MNRIDIAKKTKLNDSITAPQIRLINEQGEQVGIVSLQEAIQSAYAVDLDLVEIVPKAEPPVCRIMDFGKYLFNLNKKKQASKKKQQQIQIKEVKFRPNTDDGDYKIKLRNITRFLANGDKVKVTLRFRGREMAHQDLGMKMLRRIEADVADESIVEQFPKMEGRQMVMLFSPKAIKN